MEETRNTSKVTRHADNNVKNMEKMTANVEILSKKIPFKF